MIAKTLISLKRCSEDDPKGGRLKRLSSIGTIQFFFSNMQVTNSATIVDYFPEAFIAEADDIKGMKVVVKRFIRRVTFRVNGMKSYSTILGIEAKYDWHARIANGAEVTDFNLDKMPRSEYAPMACVG